MSMLLMTGQVANVLETPKGKNREGQEYGGYHQVQLLCDQTLTNGEKRMEIFTLRTDHPEEFRKLQGKAVSVPVGVFARGGNLNFYMEKGGLPKPLPSQANSQ